jgi:2-polyprenyl-3-methyl-5-hydroxy-6-metoxy-1,4-benzoquinol methylase
MSIYQPLTIYDESKQTHVALNRMAYLVRQTIEKRVLHVGCCDYPLTMERVRDGNLLHHAIGETAKHVVGMDLSISGIEILRNHGTSNLVVMDAEELCFRGTFDVVLAGDVIEHLSNPGKFLERVPALLTPTSELIIAVPNAFSLAAVKVWIGRAEATHRDHTFFF